MARCLISESSSSKKVAASARPSSTVRKVSWAATVILHVQSIWGNSVADMVKGMVELVVFERNCVISVTEIV